MAVQVDQATESRGPLFRKFGLTIYREDIKIVLTGAIAHPWAAETILMLAICIVFLALGFKGGMKPNSEVNVFLMILLVGAFLIVLGFMMEMEIKIKTLLPLIFMIIVFFVYGSGKASHNSELNDVAPPSTPSIPNSNVHGEYETIAQSVCTSMAIKEGCAGWTFAIKRQCDSVTEPCQKLCGLQALHDLDQQSRKQQWSCLGAIHVYGNRPVSNPSTTSNPSIGYKVYWSPSYHVGGSCGPNYCCCLAAA